MGCGDSKPNITGHESPDETPKDDQKNDSTKKDEEINLLRFKIEVLINMLGLEEKKVEAVNKRLEALKWVLLSHGVSSDALATLMKSELSNSTNSTPFLDIDLTGPIARVRQDFEVHKIDIIQSFADIDGKIMSSMQRDAFTRQLYGCTESITKMDSQAIAWRFYDGQAVSVAEFLSFFLTPEPIRKAQAAATSVRMSLDILNLEITEADEDPDLVKFESHPSSRLNAGVSKLATMWPAVGDTLDQVFKREGARTGQVMMVDDFKALLHSICGPNSAVLSASTDVGSSNIEPLNVDDVDLLVERFEIGGRIHCGHMMDFFRQQHQHGVNKHGRVVMSASASPFRVSSEWGRLKASAGLTSCDDGQLSIRKKTPKRRPQSAVPFSADKAVVSAASVEGTRGGQTPSRLAGPDVEKRGSGNDAKPVGAADPTARGDESKEKLLGAPIASASPRQPVEKKGFFPMGLGSAMRSSKGSAPREEANGEKSVDKEDDRLGAEQQPTEDRRNGGQEEGGASTDPPLEAVPNPSTSDDAAPAPESGSGPTPAPSRSFFGFKSRKQPNSNEVEVAAPKLEPASTPTVATADDNAREKIETPSSKSSFGLFGRKPPPSPAPAPVLAPAPVVDADAAGPNTIAGRPIGDQDPKQAPPAITASPAPKGFSFFGKKPSPAVEAPSPNIAATKAQSDDAAIEGISQEDSQTNPGDAAPQIDTASPAPKKGFSLFGRKPSPGLKGAAATDGAKEGADARGDPAPSPAPKGFGLFGRKPSPGPKEATAADDSALPQSESAAPSSSSSKPPAKSFFGFLASKKSATPASQAVPDSEGLNADQEGQLNKEGGLGDDTSAHPSASALADGQATPRADAKFSEPSGTGDHAKGDVKTPRKEESGAKGRASPPTSMSAKDEDEDPEVGLSRSRTEAIIGYTHSDSDSDGKDGQSSLRGGDSKVNQAKSKPGAKEVSTGSQDRNSVLDNTPTANAANDDDDDDDEGDGIEPFSNLEGGD